MIRAAIAASILATVALFDPSTAVDAAGPRDVVAQQSIVLGQPFTLKYGETAQLADDPLRITFDKVVEDSRCPVKVQCVWAGRVIVGLTAALPDGPTTSFELQLGASKGVLNYNVALSGVAPAKTGEMQPSDDKYVLTLTVNPAR